MTRPVFTGPDAFRAAMSHILSTIPQGAGDIPLPFAEFGPKLKVRRVVVPEGGTIEDAIKGVLAEIEADFKAKHAAEIDAQNGINAVSVDTACDCPACAPTALVTDAQNGDPDDASDEDVTDHPLTKIFRARVKRLVESFVSLTFPELEVWTEESDFGQTGSYTFNLVVTGVESLDETDTIVVNVPDQLMDATNLELVGALTGVLNYVGASIDNLID